MEGKHDQTNVIIDGEPNKKTLSGMEKQGSGISSEFTEKKKTKKGTSSGS